MHEAGLLRGVVKHLEGLAAEHQCDRIVGVKLHIRDSGDYSADHFRDHLLALSPGTVLEHATVDMEMVADPLHTGAPEITIISIEVPD